MSKPFVSAGNEYLYSLVKSVRSERPYGTKISVHVYICVRGTRQHKSFTLYLKYTKSGIP